MHTTYVLAGVGLVVIGLGTYLALGRAQSPTLPLAATSTPTTLRELAASASPQKCTFAYTNTTQGTVYVVQGKVRSDFATTFAGKDIAGHAIVLDATAYAWMDGSTQGFKNSFDLLATTTTVASAQGPNPDERVNYDCKPWTPDQSQFTLPANITFKTVSDLQVQAGTKAVGASCSQCDLIPDATAKAQCKAALHC